MPCLRNSCVSFRVSAPCSLIYEDRGDSRPIQIHEIPSSTNSRMEYWLIALADEKTYSDQGLLAAFMQSSSCMARRLCSRKFSSMTKNDFAPSFDSISAITDRKSTRLNSSHLGIS